MSKKVGNGNDWKLTGKKVCKFLVFTIIPGVIAYFLDANPAIAGLTVGAILTGFTDWLKHRKA